MTVAEEIKETLRLAMPSAEIHVLDPRNDDTHLEAIIISPEFEGKSLIEQHRLVMTPLNEHFQQGLHALSINTYTPERWKQKQES